MLFSARFGPALDLTRLGKEWVEYYETTPSCGCPCMCVLCFTQANADGIQRDFGGWTGYLRYTLPLRAMALYVGLLAVVSQMGFYNVATIAEAFSTASFPVRCRILQAEAFRHVATFIFVMIMFKVIDHYAFYLMKSRCSRHPTLRAPSLASSAAMMAFLVLVAAFTFVTYPTIRHLSDNRIRATRCHRSRFHDGVRLAANANPVVVAACSPAAPASVAACLVARQRCNLIRLACLAETPSLCYHPVHDLHGDLLRIFPSIPALALLLRMQL